MALGVKNINTIWDWITGPLFAGLVGPLVFRWYWGRFNGYGFTAGTAIGVVTALVLKFWFGTLPVFVTFPLTLVLSSMAAVVVSLLTEPVEPATLEKYYRRMRPAGIWRKQASMVPHRERLRLRMENRFDFLNMFLALGFQMALFVLAISVVLHNWTAVGWCSFAVALLGISLYFCWYRRLPEKKIEH